MAAPTAAGGKEPPPFPAGCCSSRTPRPFSLRKVSVVAAACRGGGSAVSERTPCTLPPPQPTDHRATTQTPRHAHTPVDGGTPSIPSPPPNPAAAHPSAFARLGHRDLDLLAWNDRGGDEARRGGGGLLHNARLDLVQSSAASAAVARRCAANGDATRPSRPRAPP